MSNDNIVDFSQKIKQLREAKKPSVDEQGQDFFPDEVLVPKPDMEDLASFVQVLIYLRQISPDGIAHIDIDQFMARIALNSGHGYLWDDPDGGVHISENIEAVLPLFYTCMKEEEKVYEEEASFQEVVLSTYSIFDRLHPRDEDEE